MHELNLWTAWAGILVGMLSGAAIGLGFHRSEFAGGYDGWPRRLMRLGHVSFFGLAMVNFMFYLTVELTGIAGGAISLASGLLVAGAVTMPVVCFAAAWRKPWRHAFCVPVACLIAGVAALMIGGLS